MESRRMVFLIRKDVALSPSELAGIVGSAVGSRLFIDWPRGMELSPLLERMSWLESPLRTKIALGLKSAQFHKVLAKLEKAELEHSVIQHHGDNLMIVLGPCLKEEHDPITKRLQLFRPKVVKTAENVKEVTGTNLVYFVRQDLEMPAGKLAAQLGHGIEGLLLKPGAISFPDVNAETPVYLCGVESEHQLVNLHAQELRDMQDVLVVDSGLTCFEGKTPTLIASVLNAPMAQWAISKYAPYRFWES